MALKRLPDIPGCVCAVVAHRMGLPVSRASAPATNARHPPGARKTVAGKKK